MSTNKCRTCGEEYHGDMYKPDQKDCNRCAERERVMTSLVPRLQADLKKHKVPRERIDRGINTITEKRHLYLTGPVGGGKTVYAASLLLASVEIKKMLYGPRLFSIVPNLLQQIRFSYGKSESKEEEIVKVHHEAAVLVLDDLGAEKTTDWSLQVLYTIITHRYDHCKPTIFTSNLSLDQLAEKLGDDRIPSRINGMCEVILFNYKDLRTT